MDPAAGCSTICMITAYRYLERIILYCTLVLIKNSWRCGMHADMERDAPRSQIAKDMLKQVESWARDHASEIDAHDKQEREIALTAGARKRGSVPLKLGDVVASGNGVTQKAMANVVAIRVEEEWSRRAKHAEKELARMRLGGNMSNPFLVVPTSDLLRVPDLSLIHI